MWDAFLLYSSWLERSALRSRFLIMSGIQMLDLWIAERIFRLTHMAEQEILNLYLSVGCWWFISQGKTPSDHEGHLIFLEYVFLCLLTLLLKKQVGKHGREIATLQSYYHLQIWNLSTSDRDIPCQLIFHLASFSRKKNGNIVYTCHTLHLIMCPSH